MTSESLAKLAYMRLTRQLSAIADITAEDETMISRLPLRIVTIAQHHDIIRQGERTSDCCLLISGLVCGYKLVAGGRRQILSLHHAGDVPDLQSLTIERMDHGLATLTRSVVAFIPHELILALLRNSPTLEHAFRRHEQVHASISREWVANIGQRDANTRLGHLFCEIQARLHALELEEDDCITLNMTQAEIGEAIGLSPVHVNRVMQRLRAQGYIKTERHTHIILDLPGLQNASDFNIDYLHLRARPAASSWGAQ